MAGMAEKSLRQVRQAVIRLLEANEMPREKAEDLAELLSSGRWTHDYPIMYEEAKELGFPVSDEMPIAVHQLMDLYPQPRSSVHYNQPVPGKPKGSQDETE